MPSSGPRKGKSVTEWLSQVDGYLRFLEKLPDATTPLGADAQRWRDGMKAHYGKLITQALSAPPPGAERYVKALRSRLRKV